MYHEIFLVALALIWIIFASIQDLKKRMVSNWISFSLIIFALGFRFFYSLFESVGFAFFYQGLIGLGIFFIIGNALYYARLFAGGDAKLMIALGTVLPFSNIFSTNLKIFTLFLVFFLFVGGFYGLFWSVYLTSRNLKIFKKEFSKQFNHNKKLISMVMAFALFIMILGFFETFIFYLGLLVFIIPYLHIYAKTIDESILVKEVKTSKLEEGDWLFEDLRMGRKMIKASWHGLSKNQIKEIRKKYKAIKIKEGIPFVPVFLISFSILIYFYFGNISFLGFPF